jgi:sugar lactone lactonase YvrE
MTHGASSTLAQTIRTAVFNNPPGLAMDSKGDIYVTDRGIRKITPDGNVSTFAGLDSPYEGPKNENLRKGGDWSPHYIAVDKAGNLYATEWDGTKVYKVTSAGVVSILTNEAKKTRGIAVDRDGTIYFADLGMIRKMTSAGVVETLAPFSSWGGIAVDSANNVYATDGYTIRKITPAGVVTTIAGAADKRGYVDGPGSAARFYDARDIAADNADNLYVSDQRTIRKITPDGVVSTVAGKPTLGPFSGGFHTPSGLAVDKAGNVYVTDAGAALIRKVTAAGVVSTLAGKAGITDEEQDRAIEEEKKRGGQ